MDEITEIKVAKKRAKHFVEKFGVPLYRPSFATHGLAAPVDNLALIVDCMGPDPDEKDYAYTLHRTWSTSIKVNKFLNQHSVQRDKVAVYWLKIFLDYVDSVADLSKLRGESHAVQK